MVCRDEYRECWLCRQSAAFIVAMFMYVMRGMRSMWVSMWQVRLRGRVCRGVMFLCMSLSSPVCRVPVLTLSLCGIRESWISLIYRVWLRSVSRGESNLFVVYNVDSPLLLVETRQAAAHTTLKSVTPTALLLIQTLSNYSTVWRWKINKVKDSFCRLMWRLMIH